jgi:regulatory protein SWI5
MPEVHTSAPTQRQIDDLELHIKSVYGQFGDVYINILPTPVATPQKRASVAPAENIEVSPLPLTFDPSEVHLDPSLVEQDFKFPLQSPHSDHGYESPFASSPAHSIHCSPTAPHVKTFVSDMSHSQYSPVNEQTLFAPQTTLVDVETFVGTSDSLSPGESPRPVSLADLSIDGTIEDTGISAEEVQQYISQQDPVNHRWTCLYPGCQAKTFGRRENIRSHVQTHLGDRQYRCNHCGKCFVRQHDLKRHSKIHSGNKPYRCPCGGGFARQDALTRHRQRGMCIGGFPNAVRKQARRGRPRKHRPDMEDRLDKAARTRERADSSSSESVGSGAEDSPSPPAFPDMAPLDSTELVSLHEDREIDNFG